MVSKEEVQHLAQLARLSVTEAEAEHFATQMSAILDHVQKVQEISSADQVIPEHRNIFREDNAPHEGGVYSDDLLANAKKTKDAFITTSKIISND